MRLSLILLSTIALFSLSLASVVAPNGIRQVAYPQPPDNCEVPPLVSYCIDVMKLGSSYDEKDAGTPALAELKADIAEIPMGACSWVEYTGTATVQDCMQAFEEYVGKDYDWVDENVEEEEEEEIVTTDRGLFKKLKKKIKKAIEKVNKARCEQGGGEWSKEGCEEGG